MFCVLRLPSVLRPPKAMPVDLAASGIEFGCPMCPTVIGDKPGTCPICGMALEPRLSVVQPPRKRFSEMTLAFFGQLDPECTGLVNAMVEMVRGPGSFFQSRCRVRPDPRSASFFGAGFRSSTGHAVHWQLSAQHVHTDRHGHLGLLGHELRGAAGGRRHLQWHRHALCAYAGNRLRVLSC